jgi:hypothetical protein
MATQESMMDVAAEIRDAINDLTKELREVRVALNAIHDIVEEVVDKGAGDFPGFIRIRNES